MCNYHEWICNYPSRILKNNFLPWGILAHEIFDWIRYGITDGISMWYPKCMFFEFHRHYWSEWYDCFVTAVPVHQLQIFNKREGLALAYAVTKLAHLKSKVVGLEEVVQFGRHPQCQIFVRILEWIGYAIMSNQTLNLNRVLPQNRSRVLLVAVHKSATDAYKLIDWVDWIPEQVSLKNSGCFADFDKNTMHDLIPSNNILNIYLDPKNLPRHPDGGEYAKRSIDEIVKYRIRGPDNASFSYIMADYSKGHTLPDMVLK